MSSLHLLRVSRNEKGTACVPIVGATRPGWPMATFLESWPSPAPGLTPSLAERQTKFSRMEEKGSILKSF
jgi:hypothetical protein